LTTTPEIEPAENAAPASGAGRGVDVLTLGCRLNTLESEMIRREAEAAGHSDLVVVNTCAVTNEAVRQARQTVRRLRRERPTAKIVVTGCAAQTEPETFADIDAVDLVLGNDAKTEAQTWADLARFGIGEGERVRVNDIMSVRETAGHLVDGLDGRARAFVQVQNGCDHRCTFCIIPYGRGNARSVPMGLVVDQIRRLVDNGYREVVLTGVDLTSYGPDLPGTPKLGDLVQRILTLVPDLARLRLSSIDSIEVDPALMAAIADAPRLLAHFHLSLQAGDDMILKRMKRRHLRDDAIRFCADVRALRPDVVFGADLIAGFPTETEAMFENTRALVADCGLTHLHVFPFSPRPGTPAARMPQLDRATVKDRAARLRAEGERAFAAHLASEVGRVRQVLIEREGLGRTEGFTPVSVAGPAGALVSTRILGADRDRLLGEPVSEAA
jgi:threonylcarbamoyladenosine tRNA methylthiotransferase MtaB